MVIHEEKNFKNEETVKIKFEIFLKPRRLRPSFQKLLDELTMFDMDLAREKAVERMKN